MTMKKRLLILMVLFLLGIVAGCDKGTEYEGKWVVVQGVVVQEMEIKRNSDQFDITMNVQGYQDIGKTEGERGKRAAWVTNNVPANAFTALLQDGKLVLQPKNITLTYDKATDTITTPVGEVLQRETPAVMTKLKQQVTTAVKAQYPQVTFEQ